MANFIETEQIKIETNNNFSKMLETASLEDFKKINILYLRQYVYSKHTDTSISIETRKNNAAKWLYETYGLSVRHISGLPEEENVEWSTFKLFKSNKTK